MKKFRRGAALVLSITLLLTWLPLQSAASLADEQESEWLGEICEFYESGISREDYPDDFKYRRAGLGASNAGDPGGRSYGAYQLASKAGSPKIFFEWCQKHENEEYRAIGNRLYDAYNYGSPGYGANFNKAWRELAEEYPELFWQAQHDFAIDTFYRPTVSWLEANVPGFRVENYSIALRNTLFSRAIQHGTGGVRNVVTRAFEALGGFANQPETELIAAIYAESGAVREPRDGDSYIMSSSEARKYGIDGKVMKYFYGSSGSIQTHVYARLRINEPVLIHTMLQRLAYNDLETYTVDQGIYQLLPMENTALALNDKLTLTAAEQTDSQHFKLTYYASGCYTVTHEASGLRVTCGSDGKVTLQKPTADNNQFWIIAPFNGGFSLKNRATGRYLTTTALSAGGLASSAETARQWQLAVAGSDWTLTGASYPTLESGLTAGNTSFVLKGMLSSTSPITKVTVSVKRDSGEDAFTPASAAPNAAYYDLNALDNAVRFSKLTPGYYTFIIEAKNQRGDSYRYTSDFVVSGDAPVVIFDACGGSCDVAQRTMTAGSKYGTLPAASREGYRFLGWFTSAEGGTQVQETDPVPDGKTNLYAHYERYYTYRFVNFDGSVVASGKLAEGAVIPAPAEPTRGAEGNTYFTFDGWDGYTEEMTIHADLTFTALYTAHEQEVLPPEMQSDTYAIVDDLLRHIPVGTTASELASHILPAGAVRVMKGGAPVDGKALAATGMTVEYTANGETRQTLTLVVTGDINGDGNCTITDLVQIQSCLLKKTSLSGVAAEAADLNADGKVTITDLVQIQSYLLKKSSIIPN